MDRPARWASHALDVVGWVELFAKPTNSAAAMGFVTSSDMRPIWSLYPSYESVG
jgi:hypothetical protein